jgi:Fe-S cluster biogenesis protein NfuA
MNKPDLVITSSPDDGFLEGHCSSCHSVKFTLQGNTMHHKMLLRGMFDQHFKRVHLREDASQAAARIVREATKDH